MKPPNVIDTKTIINIISAGKRINIHSKTSIFNVFHRFLSLRRDIFFLGIIILKWIKNISTEQIINTILRSFKQSHNNDMDTEIPIITIPYTVKIP